MTTWTNSGQRMPALRARKRIASLSRNAARRRLAHAGHAEVLAQHRGGLDVEIVERDDAIEPLGAREVRGAGADVLRGHVAANVVEGVDGVARPVGVAQLLLGEEQDPASLRWWHSSRKSSPLR